MTVNDEESETNEKSDVESSEQVSSLFSTINERSYFRRTNFRICLFVCLFVFKNSRLCSRNKLLCLIRESLCQFRELWHSQKFYA